MKIVNLHYLFFSLLIFYIVACQESTGITTEPTFIPPTLLPTKKIVDNEPIPTPQPFVPPGPLVNDIELMVFESFPVQVNVIIYGTLPDHCTSIASVDTLRDDDRLIVNLNTSSTIDCAIGAKRYEQIVKLNVEDLRAGTYYVDVEGVRESFELKIDNFIIPNADSSSDIPNNGVVPLVTISGMVWNDLCDTSLIIWGKPLPDGCLNTMGGRVQANGKIDADEVGIPDVLMVIGKGQCSSNTVPFLDTMTNKNGEFSFPDLEIELWCVYIDLDTGANVPILQMGNGSTVTAPMRDRTGITIRPEELLSSTVVNFGWDYDDN